MTNNTETTTTETATNIGWKSIDGAKREARKVGGRVIQLQSGRYVVRGQALLNRDGKVSHIHYGPRGATYVFLVE